MKYYVRVGGDNQGPFSIDELRARGLAPSEYVWRDGLADWQPAGGLPELAGVLRSANIVNKAVYTGDPASPYASPVSTGYGEFSPVAGTGPLRQSGFGIASTVIGVATVVCAFAGLMIIGFLQEQGARAGDPTPLMIVLSLGVCFGGPLFHLLGVVLGVVGIFQQDRSKLFGIIGTVLNGLVMVIGVAFIAIAALIGMSAAR